MEWENLRPSQIVVIDELIEQVEGVLELQDLIGNGDMDFYALFNKYKNIKRQNKSYRAVLENIRSVKHDDDFNPYAYMMLEIIEWAEKELEGEE